MNKTAWSGLVIAVMISLSGCSTTKSSSQHIEVCVDAGIYPPPPEVAALCAAIQGTYSSLKLRHHRIFTIFINISEDHRRFFIEHRGRIAIKFGLDEYTSTDQGPKDRSNGENALVIDVERTVIKEDAAAVVITTHLPSESYAYAYLLRRMDGRWVIVERKFRWAT